MTDSSDEEHGPAKPSQLPRVTRALRARGRMWLRQQRQRHGALMRVKYLVAVVLPCWAALAGACGSDRDGKLALGATCSATSDCSPGLTCAFGLCHSQCRDTKSCPGGERCVSSGVASVCLL